MCTNAVFSCVFAFAYFVNAHLFAKWQHRSSDKCCLHFQLQRYTEAVEAVMKPVQLLVEPVHPHKIWEELGYST